jgi:hypothetical protein
MNKIWIATVTLKNADFKFFGVGAETSGAYRADNSKAQDLGAQFGDAARSTEIRLSPIRTVSTK